VSASARVLKMLLFVYVDFLTIGAGHGLAAFSNERLSGLRIIFHRLGDGRMLYNRAAVTAFKYPASHIHLLHHGVGIPLCSPHISGETADLL